MKELLNAEEVQAALDDLYEAVCAHCPADEPLAVVGIRTRGETISRRLVERLRADRPDQPLARGVLDITFYRDDLSRRKRAPMVRATEIDFEIDDARVLLIDDVIQTGRSIRAALDALHDFGRPGVVRLGVLVDRGGRELPIAADYAGRRVEVPDDLRVQVRLEENDGTEGVFTVPRD